MTAVLAGAPSGARAQPNIILIVVDTLRADRLSQYGHTRDTSSVLAKLTDSATRFEETYSPAPWTKPAVASLFTGLPPATHRVERVGSILADKADTLAERLQAAGWNTAAFTFNPHITRKARFDQGFDEFLSYRGDSKRAPDVREMTRVAWDWIGEERVGPFFLYLQPMNVHGPYRVPIDAQSLLLGRRPVGGFEFFGPLMKSLMNDGELERRNEITPAFLTSMNERYDTAVRHTSEELARFFDRLEEAGLWNDSLVILTSDHGEELYDHGGFSHRYSLHREVLRVPLFVKLPGLRQQRVIHEPVSLTDVYATILEVAGQSSAGHSLMPFLRSDVPVPASLRERNLVASVMNPRRCQATSLRRGSHSLLITRRNYEGIKNRVSLYDLSSDTSEMNDIAALHAKRVADMRAELERMQQRARRDELPKETFEIDATERSQLEALGYF